MMAHIINGVPAVGLEWWEASSASEHDKRLIRIGYYERIADERKHAAALCKAVLLGQLPTMGTETPVIWVC